MISAHIQQQLDIAKDNETNYQPSTDVQASLSTKDLIMTVGPAAVGKSTLMNKIVELDSEFQFVHNRTSRPKRLGDEEGRYTYIPHTDDGLTTVLNMIEKRELVQYAIFPTTGYIYATMPTDYAAHYNLLDTQAQVVSSLKMLPFHKVHTAVIVTDPANWKEWFNKRYENDQKERKKRLDEAILSLELMTAEPPESIHWIYNKPEDLESSAKELISIVTSGGKSDPNNREKAVSMLYLAYQMKE